MLRESAELNKKKTKNGDKQKKNGDGAERCDHIERGFIGVKERACRLTGCMTDRMTIEGIRSENT